MWQRIQTLYLAISTVLIVLMFFMDKAVIPSGTPGEFIEEFRFTAYVPYLILVIIISLLDLLALTSYKFRVFQMRTAILSSLITLALQIWIGIDYFTADSNVVFKTPSIFPIVSIICNLLAAKGIYSDELMVTAYSHFRTDRKNRKRK